MQNSPHSDPSNSNIAPKSARWEIALINQSVLSLLYSGPFTHVVFITCPNLGATPRTDHKNWISSFMREAHSLAYPEIRRDVNKSKEKHSGFLGNLLCELFG